MASRTLLHTKELDDITLASIDYLLALLTIFLFSVDTACLLLTSFECPLYNEYNRTKRIEKLERK